MKVAVCLIARDEERDIAQWLAFQFAVGFDAVIVYDNGSIDRTPDIVRAFGRHFDVRLKDWPSTEADAQQEAYEDCLAHFGFEFQWIAFIDADELIVPRRGDVRDLIAANADASAIVVNWAMFGSSGHKTRPPGLMVETFRHRAKSDLPACRFVKSIVRTATVRGVRDPHAFLLTGPARTPAGRSPRWLLRQATRGVEHSVAQVNHYFTKSRQEWQERQSRGYRRGHGGWRAEPFAKYDHNVIEDRSALRFLPQVHGILDRALHAGHECAPHSDPRVGVEHHGLWPSDELRP